MDETSFQMNEKGETKYAHMWLDDGVRVGRATLAFRSDGNLLTGALAFCSPNDRYYRTFGRALAEANLNEGRGVFQVVVPANAKWYPASYMREYVVEALAARGELGQSICAPRWAYGCTAEFNGEISDDTRARYRPLYDCVNPVVVYAVVSKTDPTFSAGPFFSLDDAERTSKFFNKNSPGPFEIRKIRMYQEDTNVRIVST